MLSMVVWYHTTHNNIKRVSSTLARGGTHIFYELTYVSY
jgi:hypothetical protein